MTDSVVERRTRKGCLPTGAGGRRRRAGPKVCLPGGQIGEVRTRVRFLDEATEIVVEGEEVPTLCTGPEGVRQLVKVLRCAVEVLSDGNVCDADAEEQVADALDQVWEKCGLEFLRPEDNSVAELFEGMKRIEHNLSELCVGWSVGALW